MPYFGKKFRQNVSKSKMTSDDRGSSTTKKSLYILLALCCGSLIVICYVHVLPPAPLISIRRRNATAVTISEVIASVPSPASSGHVITNAISMSVYNVTVKGFNELKNNHKRKKLKSYFTATKEPKSSLLPCKEPNIEDGGPIKPNITLEQLDVVEAELGPLLKPGGFFEPKDCKAKYHVAIIVPFRDRYAHLSIFLRNLHPFLMKQNISYRIFIIEQTNGQPFNRAALFNVGFLEALKFYNWDCFIFHDVDLLPLDDRNLYNCPRQPRHMSVATDTFNYKLPYSSIFGGVSSMTRKQFEAVNGFSNAYFGWGGEDDDMSNRIKHAGYFISRYPINIARYMMLRHQREKANPKRFETLANGINKFRLDGLNSISYEVFSTKTFPVFTWCLVQLKTMETKS